jgi:TIR domain
MATIFVSNRSADNDEARRLASELIDCGHQVWFDQWRIDLGDSIVQKMDEGLTGSTFVVLCYSSSGVLSPWISREWMSALAAQLDGRGVKVLPVRLTGGEPPAILRDIKYADLARDWTAGVRQLLKAVSAP